MRTLEELVAGYKAHTNWAEAEVGGDPDRIYTEDDSEEDLAQLAEEIKQLLDADADFAARMENAELKLLVNHFGEDELTKQFPKAAKRKARVDRMMHPRAYFEQLAIIALERLISE